MRQLLRLASAGGWLANFQNQRGDPGNSDNSHEVRPWFLVIIIFIFALGPVVVGVLEIEYLLGYASHPPLRSGQEGVLIPLGLAAAFALSLAVGWLVRFVPFVPDKDQRPGQAAPIPARTEITVHATGIFGVPGYLRRFRHRPARIEKWEDGELDVYVKRNRPFIERVPDVQVEEREGSALSSDVAGHWPISQAAAFRRANVRKVRRGTAHLVSEARPAIELVWLHGPILLDFDDVETRDQVFAELQRMLGDAPWYERNHGQGY
jgi:hypothetical protein